MLMEAAMRKKKVSDVSDAEQKETKNSNKQVNEALQMCICFPKIQTNKQKKIKNKFSEVCYSQMCFGFLLHKQSCKWDLYKFVLISWPGAASRYLLHRRILIAASRVGRSLGSQCTEDEMRQAAVAWRGACTQIWRAPLWHQISAWHLFSKLHSYCLAEESETLASLNGFSVVVVGSHYCSRWSFEKWMGKEERLNDERVQLWSPRTDKTR